MSTTPVVWTASTQYLQFTSFSGKLFINFGEVSCYNRTRNSLEHSQL